MTKKTRRTLNPDDYPAYFKKGKNNMIVKLPNVRLAFPHLFTPQTQDDGKSSYNACFIIDPDAECIAEIEAAIEEVAEKKWGKKAEKVLEELRRKGRVCLREGDFDKAQYDGFEGNYYVSANNKVRPLVIDRYKNELTQADGKPYAGCYVTASVEIWPQDNKHGKRVNAELRGVQFLRDGEAFAGGAPASVDEFDDLSEGIDEDEMELA